jgi:hypothetical protein
VPSLLDDSSSPADVDDSDEVLVSAVVLLESGSPDADEVVPPTSVGSGSVLDESGSVTLSPSLSADAELELELDASSWALVESSPHPNGSGSRPRAPSRTIPVMRMRGILLGKSERCTAHGAARPPRRTARRARHS